MWDWVQQCPRRVNSFYTTLTADQVGGSRLRQRCLDVICRDPATVSLVDMTTDRTWWHPVAVTDPNLRVADSPLPVEEFFATIQDALQLQDASTPQERSVFRCA